MARGNFGDSWCVAAEWLDMRPNMRAGPRTLACHRQPIRCPMHGGKQQEASVSKTWSRHPSQCSTRVPQRYQAVVVRPANAAILPHVHHRSQNSTRTSFLPMFLATVRSRHAVPAKLPLVAHKSEKVTANVPPARCFLQLRHGIPRGVAALRLHTHWAGTTRGWRGISNNDTNVTKTSILYYHVKSLFNII